MSSEMGSSGYSECETFLQSFGKTLGRVNLYSMNHPLALESLKSSFEALNKALAGHPEFTVSFTTENKMLIDGEPLSGMGSFEQILSNIFERFQIHSLTFKSGCSLSELTSFYKLLVTKEGLIKDRDSVKIFFEKENVSHIQIDTSFYAKVGGDQPGTKSGEPNTTKDQIAKEAANQFVQTVSQMGSLETMLNEIVKKSVPDPEMQKKIFEIIIKQMQSELQDYVRKATEQLEKDKKQLINEQARTEAVITHLADGAIVVDDQGRIVNMNPAAEKVYGASLSELKGKKLTEIAKEEVMIALAKELTLSEDKEFSKEVVVQSPQNIQQTIKTATTTIQNPDGKIVGVMSILQDIAKMRELQRMQNDFMAHVTHELRSPLTAIKAALGTLDDEKTPLSPSQNQVVTIANRNIDRLARLINDLLDSAKIEAGKMTINPRPIESEPILQEAVNSLQSWAQSKQIRLTFEPSGILPIIFADPDRITQIVVNLISNAIKFTPKGGNIKVHTKSSGNYLTVNITDSGQGISKENQQKLFNKFFQLAQKEKMDTPGTGLGLHIAKTFIELQNGQMGIESEEGKGSTFFFTIPCQTQTDERKETAPKLQQESIQKKKSWFAKLFGR